MPRTSRLDAFPIALALALALLCGAGRPAGAREAPAADLCGGAQAVQGWVSPRDPVVVARILFVGFPNEPERSHRPLWAESMRDELAAFLVSMSRGAQRFDIQLLSPPGDASGAWIAQRPFGSWGDLNTQIFEQVAAAYRPVSVWSGVEMVFVVHSRCAWEACGVAGVASLGPLLRAVPGFAGSGVTLHLNDGHAIDDERNRSMALWVAGHEYGHLLGLDHPPHSRTDEPPHVNMGIYDLMSGSAGYGVTSRGLLPYHPLQLAALRWLEVEPVRGSIPALSVPDVRQSGVAMRVDTPDPGQYFLLVNHQGTGYDAGYPGTGLLVWHIVQRRAWDLESAAGKLRDGRPDPDAGRDALEASDFNTGSSGDFFDGAAKIDFDAGSNPSTDLHEALDYTAAQTRPSYVQLSRIRRDAGSSDMLVDVHLAPAAPSRQVPAAWLAVGARAAGRGGVEFELRSGGAGRARLDVFTADGRLVRRVLDREVPAGTHTISWDGAGPRGRRVARGVYFYEASLGTERRAGRILLMR